MLIGRYEMFVDRRLVPGSVILFFLVSQPIYCIEPGGKGLGHKAVVCVNEIGVAGGDNAVDDCITEAQARLGFLFLKGYDAVIIGVNGGQQRKVVLNILPAVKGVLG